MCGCYVSKVLRPCRHFRIWPDERIRLSFSSTSFYHSHWSPGHWVDGCFVSASGLVSNYLPSGALLCGSCGGT